MSCNTNIYVIMVAILIVSFDRNHFVNGIWQCTEKTNPSPATSSIAATTFRPTTTTTPTPTITTVKPTCLFTNMTCNVHSDCCSEMCSSTEGCVCLENGKDCQFGDQCCSFTCDFANSTTQKTCTEDPLCHFTGQDCKADSDCCSKICRIHGVCGCLPDGEKCNEFYDCCNDFCHPVSKRCACKQDGDLCLDREECCSGGCFWADGQSFGTCTKCLSAGEKCSTLNDCCGSCDDPKTCQLSDPGDPCNKDSDCDGKTAVSISCVHNRCEKCNSVGLRCKEPWDCCLGIGNNTCNMSKKLCEEVR